MGSLACDVAMDFMSIPFDGYEIGAFINRLMTGEQGISFKLADDGTLIFEKIADSTSTLKRSGIECKK